MVLIFTDASIRNLKPSERAYERFDSAQAGLLIRVQPSGVKSYYLVYRNAANVRKRFKVGTDDLSLAQARAKAKRMAAEATLGKDHIEEKRNAESGRQREKGETLIGFLEGQYRTYAEDHLKRPDEAIARVKSCFPHWLGKPLRSITDFKVLAWVRANNHKSNETIGSDLNRLSGVLTVAVNF